MTLPEPYASSDAELLKLCCYREARNQPHSAKLGVVWTVRNRCAWAPREGFKKEARGNILKPFAFSSFNPKDPNSTAFPGLHDAAWDDCAAAVNSPEADPTDGAIFYYSLPLTAPPHAWGAVKHTADIGGLHFYRK